jgi:Caspase domain/Polyglycine hydrolase-like, structural repeat
MDRLLRILSGLFTIITLVQPCSAETRVALVIGNGAYQHAPALPNPKNDATDVAAALQRDGFQTIIAVDVDKVRMDESIIRFSRAARTSDVAMFYYSGHAMQFGGVNYLVPVDGKLMDEADLRRMIRLDDIVSDLQQAKSLRILVLDSCRDNPLAEELKRSMGPSRSSSVQRGLAKIDAPLGTIVAYSTQAGRTAQDGDGHNSPYTAAFLRNIEQPREIGEVFRNISADVYRATNNEQLPELSLSIIGNFYLKGNVEINVPPPQTTRPDPCASAETHWKAADAVGSKEAYEDHLTRFPDCVFATLAKAHLDALKNGRVATNPASAAPRANDGEFSDWLSAVQYQALFGEMLKKDRYPEIVEGRSFNGGRQFRGKFTARGNLAFHSSHGVSADLFAKRNAELRADGYALVSYQTAQDQSGKFVQATWVKAP